MPEIFLEEVKRSVSRHIMPAFEPGMSIKTAELGGDAITIGAAAWAREVISGSAA